MENKPTFANRFLRTSGNLLRGGIENLIVLIILLVVMVVVYLFVPLFVYSGLGLLTEKLVSHTSIAFQILVFLIFSPVMVLFVRDFISEDRLRKMMASDYGHILGALYPLVFPILFIAIALPYFSGLSCTFKTVNLLTTVPNFPVSDNCVARFSIFYVWHILNSIPLLKIPETILWAVPHLYTDSLSGLLLLIFKIIIIFPVIKAYVVWGKISKEDEIPKKSELNDPLKAESQSVISKA